MTVRTSCMVLSAFLAWTATTVIAEDTIRLLPSMLALDGKETRHQILAELYSGDDPVGPADVQLMTDNPAVVRIDGMTIHSVANGQAVVRVVGSTSDSASVKVTVSGAEQPFRWSFRNHVEPVLAKQGCSSGACHGALAGKGGFKLSLSGYDPERDYFNLVELQSGRRVEPADPAASLMLTKPSMAVPHKGGLRLQTDSWHYRILSEWIAQGVTKPAESDAKLDHLEILPERVTLKSATCPATDREGSLCRRTCGRCDSAREVFFLQRSGGDGWCGWSDDRRGARRGRCHGMVFQSDRDCPYRRAI